MSLALISRSFSKMRVRTEKHTPQSALSILRSSLQKPLIESFELVLKMGVDPSIGEHMIRGNVYMPSGTGRTRKIAVFIPEEHKSLALSLGASIAGDDLLNEVKEGKFNFEQVLATAEMIDTLKPLARALGSRGFMPTTRNNTLITFENLEKEMKKLTKGMVNYKMTKSAIIQALIGKASFTDEQLLLNLRALMENIFQAKPKHFTSKYIKTALMTATYGKSIELDINTIDVNHYKCDLPNLTTE